METRVKMWGNSLAVRIPHVVSKKFKLRDGSAVAVAIEDDALKIRPLGCKKASLTELVSAITPENLQELIASGEPQGREVW